MFFVCAMPAGFEFEADARLYAFPREPRGEGLVILDSGAWGLAQAGRRMDEEYMARLAQHYRSFSGERVHCIAPDVYLEPYQTMANWRWWQVHCGDVVVFPVIQFRRARTLDLYLAVQQALFYAPFAPSFVAISNPGLRAIESGCMPQICASVREVTGADWLHCLGAGWDPDDIAMWREMDCFNSLDSVAYYTDAQSGWKWRVDGKREHSADNWRDLAYINARASMSIASGGSRCYD